MSPKGDVELEATAACMLAQERAIKVMAERQTGCTVGEKIELTQRSPDILFKCFRLMLTETIESPQRLYLHWQLDHKSMKPVLGWEITKANDQ
jgi:hypothetical protein